MDVLTELVRNHVEKICVLYCFSSVECILLCVGCLCRLYISPELGEVQAKVIPSESPEFRISSSTSVAWSAGGYLVRR